jgi:hypothetical protein
MFARLFHRSSRFRSGAVSARGISHVRSHRRRDRVDDFRQGLCAEYATMNFL